MYKKDVRATIEGHEIWIFEENQDHQASKIEVDGVLTQPSELPQDVKDWLRNHVTSWTHGHGFYAEGIKQRWPFSAGGPGTEAYLSGGTVPTGSKSSSGSMSELAQGFKKMLDDMKGYYESLKAGVKKDELEVILKESTETYERICPDPRKVKLAQLEAQMAAIRAELGM